MAETLARRIFEWMGRRPWALLLLTLAVALPALLLHLGWQPLLVDEPIRALVSLEMHYSGHFFAPTLQGFPYYNKPPLFNWLLVALYRLSGRADEWIVRLPTVAALLLYCTAIWRVLRPRLGSRVAFTVALAFATTGRVLFYDSFLGLIDLWHAGLTWLAFMAVWYLGQRGQWVRLFVLTYALTAVGFLLKGLPSLVFQALALGVYCFDTKQIRRLFSWQHVLGVAVLASILGTYFLVYSHHNSLSTALATLWDQSSQRTVAAQRWQDSVRYVLLFPFDFIRHFLPWTLLLVLLLRRPARQWVWAEPFLRYNALLFLAVLPVYWLSPATIPRYLFMLVPLGLTVLIPLYPSRGLGVGPASLPDADCQPVRWLDATLLLLLAVTTLAPLVGGVVAAAPALGSLGSVLLSHLRGVPAYWLLGGLLSLVLASLAYLFWKMPDYRLLLLGYFLLALRLSFDVFVFPARLATSPEVAYRAAAVRVGRETRGHPLELWPNALLDNVEAYYIARERGQTLFTARLPPRPGMLYLVEPWQAQATRRPFQVLDKFVIDRNKDFILVKFQ